MGRKKVQEKALKKLNDLVGVDSNFRDLEIRDEDKLCLLCKVATKAWKHYKRYKETEDLFDLRAFAKKFKEFAFDAKFSVRNKDGKVILFRDVRFVTISQKNRGLTRKIYKQLAKDGIDVAEMAELYIKSKYFISKSINETEMVYNIW